MPVVAGGVPLRDVRRVGPTFPDLGDRLYDMRGNCDACCGAHWVMGIREVNGGSELVNGTSVF